MLKKLKSAVWSVVIAKENLSRRNLKMELTPVNSTAVAAMGYDDSQEIMFIRYKNGNEYIYHNVPYDTYRHIKDSSSIGRALAQSGLRGSLA